ncbi:unnamed protein product [Pleuronectes platessa]|uniref:Uncharacterized protein n=1 Tax=Pleuronectes platessa TaxID=8262 RepID=A0A9N7UUN7_PLEPL|nr:unnamed protein product [Pleuronectes platessa]
MHLLPDDPENDSRTGLSVSWSAGRWLSPVRKAARGPERVRRSAAETLDSLRALLAAHLSYASVRVKVKKFNKALSP